MQVYVRKEFAMEVDQVVARWEKEEKLVATAEGRIIGPDGKLYAHATTICLIFDFPAPPSRSAYESA
ncbi:hypothetical protein D3C75_1017840 [compost metagenome]